MKVLVLGAVLSAILVVPCTAQDAPLKIGPTVVRFDFQRAELSPPRWGFEVAEDGQGRYYENTTVEPAGGPDAPENRWQSVHISAATMALLKAGSARHGDRCETAAKNIAQTGKKTLSYWHDDVPWTCEFNYSDDEGVMKTANAFQAMAETIQMGEKLAHDHRFDRLSLDADMQILEESVKAGRAIEVENIAAVLQSVADDEHVIDRARRRASRLLQDVGVSASQ